MKEKVKYILGHVGIIALLILVITGTCWVVNYEGDRIEADRQDRAALAAHHAAEDSVQRLFESRLYEAWKTKAESLTVDFYNEWMKVKDKKEFAGCSYRAREYDHDEGYENGKFAGVIVCTPHRPVPSKIGNYTVQTIRPETGEIVVIMYSLKFKTIESAVYSNEGKVSEEEAKKVINAFAKGMGLIQ